jgi:peptidoglycan/xylan/chitin deacetylase (PgdA/CDA1 family)
VVLCPLLIFSIMSISLFDFLKSCFGLPPVTTLAAALARRHPLVVLYHGVTTNAQPEGSENYRWKHIPLPAFQRQIDWLAAHFAIVPLTDIERHVQNRSPFDRPVCAITFDDGYRNNYTNAFPVLHKKKIPATFFVSTGFVDDRAALWPDRLEFAINKAQISSFAVTWSDGEKRYECQTTAQKILADGDIRGRLKRVANDVRETVIASIVTQTQADLQQELSSHPEYAPLSWQEIRQMATQGMAIGAHTVSHPILSMLPMTAQEAEIRVSAERIRAEVGQCDSFAYPNGQPGDWTQETKTALRSAGFMTAWTTEMRRIRPQQEGDLLALPRIALDAGHQDRQFAARVSNALPLAKTWMR